MERPPIKDRALHEFIPFPKTTGALDLMAGSPSAVDERQLDELGLKLKRLTFSPVPLLFLSPQSGLIPGIQAAGIDLASSPQAY
jgi:hypothetical protein